MADSDKPESDNDDNNKDKNVKKNESPRSMNSLDKLKITLPELNWALDLIQTRNCRVPKLDTTHGDIYGQLDGKVQKNDDYDYSIKFYNDFNADYVGEVEEVSKMEINGQFLRKSDTISVLAPFFDLMNHDSSVNTVFELKFLPENNVFNNSADLFGRASVPYLTVRYEGHRVKKGEQVSLNYRW